MQAFTSDKSNTDTGADYSTRKTNFTEKDRMLQIIIIITNCTP